MSTRWDENNVTPSDYTLYFTLDSEISQQFDREIFKPDQFELSRGEQFKRWIKNEILNFNRRDEVKIVRIDLAFDNQEMIELLKSRGLAIRNSNVDMVVNQELQINGRKGDHYHTTICGVFVTFEDDRNLKLVMQNFNQLPLCIYGKDVKVKRASEPSDYIWENMHYTRRR